MTPLLQNMSFLFLSTASLYPLFALMCRFDARLHLCSVGEIYIYIYIDIVEALSCHPSVCTIDERLLLVLCYHWLY